MAEEDIHSRKVARTTQLMQIHEQVPLAPYTSYKIGGPAAFFVVVSSSKELKDAIEAARERGVEPLFLSGGTNLLVPDEGLHRFVIKLELEGMEFRGSTVKVFGGTSMQEVVDAAVEHSLGGLEWAGGLPGSVGGAIRGNAGAFGGEIKDVVSSVETIDIEGSAHTYSNRESQFAYRESRFKHSGEAIVSAILSLKPDEQTKLKTLVEDHRSYRVRKHPLEHPNAGSVFKNVPLDRLPKELQETWKDKVKTDPFPVVPAAVINAAAGLAGYQVGQAQLSTKHTNYIVNLGGATAADVRQVLADVQKKVKDKFHIDLEPEILIL